ncbi:hypothetical protein V6N11_021160 [Hibiscus sabdariffa]|uniref:Uncharacterized protein n=1 Tax=Hibiscus sabdariffa TaxID=183260 RepID=A0ABR2AHJ2_9ROSI
MPNHKGLNAMVEDDSKKVKEKFSEVSTPLGWVWKKLVEHEILENTNGTRKTDIFCEFHGEDGHVIQECVEFSKNQKGKAHANKTNKDFDDEPVPEYHESIKESEAEEFLKILKHSEFNVVEQLNRLPARISMLSLLLSSEPHRNTLVKLLNQTFVPKEVSVDMVDRLVGNIAMDNFIPFSDEEIPEGTRGSHKALHITTRCKGHILPGVLIDNGPALNVLSLATLKKLPIYSTHMKAYQNAVRAFDGTQRDVLGKITIPLLIGSTKYEVDFVVMDIKTTYSCLLGRPWIHAVGAVPSTLHQKLIFVIDGKLVTVRAEEDIISTIATDKTYIEMEEDEVECSFRSLELVSVAFMEENKERKAAIAKNQERRRARLTGEDLPWDTIIFPPIGQSFVSRGLLDPKQMEEGNSPNHNPRKFKNFSETVDGNENGQMDLSLCLKSLGINVVIEDDGESPYLRKIGLCPPGFELNN